MGGSGGEPAGHARPASSIARSSERRQLEEAALSRALGSRSSFRRRGQWERQSASFCWCRGWTNQEVAAKLGITEQVVANYKFEFVAKLRAAVRTQGLPEEVFPELYQ